MQTETMSPTAIRKKTEKDSKRLGDDTSRDLSKESLLAQKKTRDLLFIYVVYSVCALLLVLLHELPGIVREDTKQPGLEHRIRSVSDSVGRHNGFIVRCELFSLCFVYCLWVRCM